MSIADIPIEEIDEAMLQTLKDDEVEEQLRIDYKSELEYSEPNQKKELLRDVSSFANTVGGDIYFWISESNGKPVAINGLEVPNADQLKLQLEQLIRDGLEPKLSGHHVGFIPLKSGKQVLVLRIPRSFAAPHRVSFQSMRQFWARRTNGKYFLDVNELRNAFSLSDTVAEKMRGFRADRVARLLADEGAVVAKKGPKLIFHLIPFDAFHIGRRVDLRSIQDLQSRLASITYGTCESSPNYIRYNLDGLFVAHTNGDDHQAVIACCQWFWNGVVESFDSLDPSKERNNLDYGYFETDLPKSVRRMLDVQKQLGVQPPIVAFLTLCDVRNHAMTVKTSRRATRTTAPTIDRDHLFIPEVMIESFDCDTRKVLGPIIDSIWNAAGYAESPVSAANR